MYLSIDCPHSKHPPSSGVCKPQKWRKAGRKVNSLLCFCTFLLLFTVVLSLSFSLFVLIVVSLCFPQSAQEVPVPAEPTSGVQPGQWRTCTGVHHTPTTVKGFWSVPNLSLFTAMLSLFPQTTLLSQSA